MIKWDVQCFEALDSTQAYVIDHIDDLNDGCCIQSLRQNLGQGRHGRKWISPEGNLYISFVLTPNVECQKLSQLALVTGLAVVKALEPYVHCVLKWPNDILFNEKKICGILIDCVGSRLVIGLGVNIKKAPIEGSGELSDYDLDINFVRDRVLSCFSSVYESYIIEGFSQIRNNWMGRSFAFDTRMSVKIGEREIFGAYKGLDDAGYLLLLCDKTNEVITITSGDVFQSDAACD